MLTCSLIAGCSGVPGKEPLSRDLPPAPVYCRTGALQALEPTADMRVAYHRRTAEAVDANRKLDKCGKWIDGVRKQYAGSKK